MILSYTVTKLGLFHVISLNIFDHQNLFVIFLKDKAKPWVQSLFKWLNFLYRQIKGTVPKETKQNSLWTSVFSLVFVNDYEQSPYDENETVVTLSIDTFTNFPLFLL